MEKGYLSIKGTTVVGSSRTFVSCDWGKAPGGSSHTEPQEVRKPPSESYTRKLQDGPASRPQFKTATTRLSEGSSTQTHLAGDRSHAHSPQQEGAEGEGQTVDPGLLSAFFLREEDICKTIFLTLGALRSRLCQDMQRCKVKNAMTAVMRFLLAVFILFPYRVATGHESGPPRSLLSPIDFAHQTRCSASLAPTCCDMLLRTTNRTEVQKSRDVPRS